MSAVLTRSPAPGRQSPHRADGVMFVAALAVFWTVALGIWAFAGLGDQRDLEHDLAGCRLLTRSGARLDCYDRLAGRTSWPAKGAVAPAADR